MKDAISATIIAALVAAIVLLTWERQALLWDREYWKGELFRMYDVRAAEREFDSQCCAPGDLSGESCHVPIYGTDC